MNQKSKALTRRKFIGDITAISALGAMELSGIGGVCALVVSCKEQQPLLEMEEGFYNPPDSTKPQVWWHWINENISKEGITRDLDAMANEGIGGATIFNLSGQADQGNIVYGTEEWQECINHAYAEAKRLGLELSFHNCGGWSTSGGPWVTADNAMKKLTYKKLKIKGPQIFSDTIDKPGHKIVNLDEVENKLVFIEDYYRDARILAYPDHEKEIPALMSESLVSLTCDKEILYKEAIYDNDILTEAIIHTGVGKVVLLFEFDNPFEASSLFIKKAWPTWNGVNYLELDVSQDNINYKNVLKSDVRTEFQTLAFSPVQSRYFKLTVSGFHGILKIPQIQFNGNVDELLTPALDQLNALSGFQVRERVLPKKILNHKKIPVKINEIVDLTENIDDRGVLRWDVPKGNWTILRIGYTLTGRKNVRGPANSLGLESDKLSSEATRAYFEGMKKVLLKGREKYIGGVIHSILMDSWEALYQNWTNNFPEEFEKRRGYSIHSFLPVISGELVENDEISYRFLWDFRRTISDLIAENHYNEFSKLCHQIGLKFEAEAAGAQQAMKDPVYYSSMVDIPMTEFWVNPFKPNGSFMDAVSGAHLYDKKVISAEAFTSPTGNWQISPAKLKTDGDQAFCWGINLFKFHSYGHQADETYPGWGMNPWGIAFNRKMPWWNHAGGYFKYLQRSQYLLQQGDFVGDVLLFYGEGVSTELNHVYGNDVLSYIPKGYKFDGCDRNTILNRLAVKDHKLVLPNGASYRLLVLPDNVQNTPELLSKIRELVHAGAIVYGPKPINSPSLSNYPQCDNAVKRIADEVWGVNGNGDGIENLYGKGKVIYGKPIKEVLTNIIIPDFECVTIQDGDSLDFIHRKTTNKDIYFISNQESHPVTVTCKFRITDKVPELWDPEKGTIATNIPFEQERFSTLIPLRLESKSSVFMVFKKSNVDDHITKIYNNGTPYLGRYSINGSKIEIAKAGKYLIKYSKKPSFEFETGLIPDSIGLKGPWKVSFDENWGGPGDVVFDTLVSWTERPEEGIKYFSGKALYEKEFMIDKVLLKPDFKINLDLGEVMETARLCLNGKWVDALWKPPYKMEISKYLKPGKNILIVEVANLWPNRVVGDLNVKHGRTYTWSNSKGHYSKESELIKSGIMGPVFLSFSKIIDLNRIDAY